ncbi:MAG TPA: heme lyase CcmF/NrfE family subunit [Thermomicrobiales bacterium]|nr:heme lyase CcmF/NrfE family subunit [Thermomicrobiales bacterium]
MAHLGHGALLVAFALSLFGIALNVIGEKRRIPELSIAGVRAVIGVTVLLFVAAVVLMIAFITHDFSFAYVSSRSSTDMPMRYVVTAFYGGQEGSLLLWTIAAGVLGSIAFARNRPRFPRLVPYAAATFLALQAFMLYMLCFVATPFLLNPVAPSEGRGLNPLLRDPGMLIHPPMLLAGYSSFAIPFSIAVAALLTGRMTTEWLRFVRRWALVSWAILGTGIFLGGWWAYHVLGWGGYWGWDPVENVSLLPWLLATAFIHSIIVQERRGMLKVWNIGLLLASYVLAIFGTFIVRSGMLQSVHSFAISEIGPYFLGFLIAIIALSVGLIAYRLPAMQAESTFDSMLSRESGFLLNNLIFAGIAFATFWGTVYPLISEAVRGTTMTVGPPFYNQVNGPLFLALLILMGIGPLLAWRQSPLRPLLRILRGPLAIATVTVFVVLLLFGQPMAAAGFAGAVFAISAVAIEYWRGAQLRQKNAGDSFAVAVFRLLRREPRRYGGYIVHLGVAVIAIGIVASTFFQSERQVVLNPGESIEIAGYTLTMNRLTETERFEGQTGSLARATPSARVITAHIDVSTNGSSQGSMQAKRFFYRGFEQQPTTQVAVNTVGFDDVYVMLVDWNDAGAAQLHVFVNPMVTWIWAGGAVYLLGMVAIFWPAPQARRVAVTAPARGRQAGEATT